MRAMPDRAAQLRQRLLATFKLEADEHLRALDSELAAIARDLAHRDVPDRLEILFRVMHTLKGAARSVGLDEVAGLCQRCETLLRDLTAGSTALDAGTLAFLQESGDALAVRIEKALQNVEGEIAARTGSPPAADQPKAGPGTAPAAAMAASTAAAERPGPAIADSSIRVAVGHLDRLSVLAEDLLLPKLAAAERALQADRVADTIRSLRDGLSSRRLADGSAGADTRLVAGLRTVEAAADTLSAALRIDHQSLRSAVDGLAEELRQTRMMPAGSILEAFPRMVRELARETGKEIDWSVTGTDLQLDRRVLDLAKDPLIHLVRNAIDHGIEPPDQRAAAGKPRQGRVSVTFDPSEGGQVSIEIADDGRGFAIAALRDAALRSRALTAEQAATLNDQEIVELAFRAGISTSPVITDISGHGRGLAIVRERVERVEGRLAVTSKAGLGSTVRLVLPASIATYRGLLIGSGGQRFLWPAESIERTFGMPRAEVEAAQARGFATQAGETLPFGTLAAILGLGETAAEPERRRLPCIVVRGGDRRGILLVDEVFGDSEAVIKDLRPPLLRVRHIMAAGLLGTGDVVLVLRPSEVLLSIRARPSPADWPADSMPARPLRVLVVDDSITTRTMERNLLEAAGYSVGVAADGEEAWTTLQTEAVDLVVSDIDMPRMDGFALTERIRTDARLAHLPVILVTALEAREDKERGVRVGANAYVLKSAFDQSNLLEIVRRLT
jgi:two-component system chemotaxis sensor kinase CheA